MHASTLDELRAAVELGANSIEHVGGGGKPRLDDEVVRLIIENGIYSVPTTVVSKIYNITEAFPARLDHPRLKADLPGAIYQDVRGSLDFYSRLNYFAGRASNQHHATKIMQLYNGVGESSSGPTQVRR